MNFLMLKERIKNFLKQWRILRDMSLSIDKAKYAGLKLGAWWVIIIPLAMALCINFVFVLAFKVDLPYFAFFVLSAILPWFFISQAVSESANAFIAQKALSKQGIFLKEFIPASTVLAAFLNFTYGFLAVIPLFLLINNSVIYLLPILLLVVILILVFALGLGFIFSSLNVFSRDIAHFLPVGLMFWFWATPVFYSENMLAMPYRWFCLLNPATYYISAFRKILYYALPPSLMELTLLIIISVSFLLFGYLFYLKNEPEILKRI
jgi:ABC-type polysaccharide/polyol phosphate export permease